jgi:hypothetical protein
MATLSSIPFSETGKPYLTSGRKKKKQNPQDIQKETVQKIMQETLSSVGFPLPENAVHSSNYTSVQLDLNKEQSDLDQELITCLREAGAISTLLSSKNKTLPLSIGIEPQTSINQSMADDEEEFRKFKELISTINNQANLRFRLLIKAIKSNQKEKIILQEIYNQIEKRQNEIKANFEDLKIWAGIKDPDENIISPENPMNLNGIPEKINKLMIQMDILKDLIFSHSSSLASFSKESYLYQYKSILGKEEDSQLLNQEMNIQTIKHYLQIEWNLFIKLCKQIPAYEKDKEEILSQIKKELENAYKDKAVTSSTAEKIMKINEHILFFQKNIYTVETKWKSIIHRKNEILSNLTLRNQFLQKEHLKLDENEKIESNFSSGEIGEIWAFYDNSSLTHPTVLEGVKLLTETTGLKEEIKTNMLAMKKASAVKSGQLYYQEHFSVFQQIQHNWEEFKKKKEAEIKIFDERIKKFDSEIKVINTRTEDILTNYQITENCLKERKAWILDKPKEDPKITSLMSYFGFKNL